MKKYNILVTGCGGDIGQSIGKILRSNDLFDRVIGGDVTDENAAKFIFDDLVILPPCQSAEYIAELQNAIDKYKIDFLLPISEPELRMLTDQGVDSDFLGVKLIAANLKSREVGFDKLSTSDFLQDSGLPFPVTKVIGEISTADFPIILKSRQGSGSKAIFIISDQQEFLFYQTKYSDFIAQELINNSPDEYTCGLYRSKAGSVRSVIYRRKLVDSYSGFGEVVYDQNITNVLTTIAEKLQLVGSINVQLKLSVAGPCVFEINPRFSSTVKFRHMMGFEDLMWSIFESIGRPLPDFVQPDKNTKFFKGFYEYIQ